LVDWVVPEEQLTETIDASIASILKGSATARGFTKKLVTSSFESDYDEAFSKYLEYQELSLLSDDHTQAMEDNRRRKERTS
jgi:enoyl-CoA hydratase/carnithine racemase